MRRALVASFVFWLVTASGGAGMPKAAAGPLTTVNGVRVELAWEPGWVAASDYPTNPDTVAFRSATPGALLVIISAVPRVPTSDIDAAMHFYLQQMVDEVKDHTVEKTLQPQAIVAGPRHGIHVSATDKAPKPGEYRFIDMVVIMDGDNPVIAKILCNEPGRADAGRALSALAEVRIVRP